MDNQAGKGGVTLSDLLRKLNAIRSNVIFEPNYHRLDELVYSSVGLNYSQTESEPVCCIPEAR